MAVGMVIFLKVVLTFFRHQDFVLMEGVFRMRNRILSLAILSVVAASANAQLFDSGAFTTSDPTFNRPLSSVSLSGVGTAVRYQVREFYVTATSTYVAEMASTSFATGGVDTYLVIYANAFNPASPLTNFVATNDDFTGTFTVLPGPYGSAVGASGTGSGGVNPASRISTTLTAGVQYFAVLTTYDNGEVGPWYLGIGGGQGQVVAGAVPEPMTMTVLALGAVAALRRRNRKS